MCESVSVDITGIQREDPPQVFESIHLLFTLSGSLDDRKVTETISDVMTMSCPVAVMIGKAMSLTWEYWIVNS